MTTVKRLLRAEDGATAIEYSLLVALVALTMIAGLRSVGTSLTGLFTMAAGVLN
jgi:pilus assembly protein Flp/PilA